MLNAICCALLRAQVPTGRAGASPVSYTHLDVYKRQVQAVTGATVSSNGIYGAVNIAIAAFSEMGGVQK